MPPNYGTANKACFVQIPSFICPSTPGDQPSDYGPYFASLGLNFGAYIAPRTDYIPIKGIHGASLGQCAGMPGTPVPNTRNGLLGTSDAEKKPRIKFSEVTDGLSNTILFGELAGRQKLYFRGKPTPGNTLTTVVAPNTVLGLTLNSFYGDHNTAREIRTYSGADPTRPNQLGCATLNVYNENGLYSFHPGGVQVAMGDGSVTFLSQSISAAVYAAIITRDGGEVVSIDQ